MWLLPSLNRPEQLRQFFKAFVETMGTTPGMVLIDKNDPAKDKYMDLYYPTGWRLVLTEGRAMGDKVREVFDQVVDLDWVGILNDDHRPRTRDWDKKIVSQITGCNVVCTNDGPSPDKPWNAPRRPAGAITFSGPLLKKLGYMFPRKLQHFYSDDVWANLFGRAGCVQFLMDVCVEHAHAYLDPSKRDETFYAVNGKADFTAIEPKGGFWETDRKEFVDWLNQDCERDFQKILDMQPKQGLMIATPSHDGNCALGYALGLADLAIHNSQHQIYFEMARVVGSSLIPHARNSLVDMFLKSKCQKLLFIDSDQSFDRNACMALFSSNRMIVAGITPHKRYPINLNFEPLPEDRKYFQSMANKLIEEFNVFIKEKGDQRGEVEVNRSGTGFMMIDRKVFEIMAPHVKEYLPFDDRDDVKHKEFFWMGGEENGRYRGEDWHFTELAKKLKIPIFINAHAFVGHQGTHIFEVRPA